MANNHEPIQAEDLTGLSPGFIIELMKQASSSRITARHSSLVTLRPGQLALGIYTSRKVEAWGEEHGLAPQPGHERLAALRLLVDQQGNCSFKLQQGFVDTAGLARTVLGTEFCLAANQPWVLLVCIKLNNFF